MGSNDSKWEQPIHPVTVPDFYLGKYPVTNAQFAAFLQDYGNDRVKEGEYAGREIIDPFRWGLQNINDQWQPATGFENHPIVAVSWYGAVEYCKWLSAQTAQPYRLPSEAEWEFAARGGNAGLNFRYAGGNKLKEVGWYEKNSHVETKPVGLKLPNELELYDMSGNVWEWCADHWRENYDGAPQDGSAWTEGGDADRRVVRGGSWGDDDDYCRVSVRYWYFTLGRYYIIGFRLARY